MGARPEVNNLVQAHLRAAAGLEPRSADAGVRAGCADSLALMPDMVRLDRSNDCAQGKKGIIESQGVQWGSQRYNRKSGSAVHAVKSTSAVQAVKGKQQGLQDGLALTPRQAGKGGKHVIMEEDTAAAVCSNRAMA